MRSLGPCSNLTGDPVRRGDQEQMLAEERRREDTGTAVSMCPGRRPGGTNPAHTRILGVRHPDRESKCVFFELLGVCYLSRPPCWLIHTSTCGSGSF